MTSSVTQTSATAPHSSHLPRVGPSSYLTLHYRITLASGPAEGQVFADTFTGRPATLQMGSGQWAPGMEAPLLEREEGEEFDFELSPAEAYGDRNPELVQKLTRQLVEQHADAPSDMQPGNMVEFAAPGGGSYAGVFKGWDGDFAIFDFNHPLAGTALQVHVAILGVL